MEKQRKIQQKEAAAAQKAQTQAAKTKHAKAVKVDEKKGKLVVTEKEKDYNVQFIFRDPPKLSMSKQIFFLFFFLSFLLS